MSPRAALAQSPSGSGNFCPVESAAGLPCNPNAQSMTATGFLYCSDGFTVSAAQGCPAGSFSTSPGAGVTPSYVAPPALPVIALPPLPVLSESMPLPAYQYVLVTNPWSTTAIVRGADLVLVWDAFAGRYDQTSSLAPGQSAWAFSYYGGEATLTALS
jgi:hypothetical protein